MQERSALIGYTGFVGSNLDRQRTFSHKYNSRNIASIEGESFDVVYCAGLSAVKWLANKEPERDAAGIAPLRKALQSVRAKRFIHLSTIDVFKDPQGVNEASPVQTEGLHPYGLHRLAFENFVREHFESACIIRLPALFGPGLKKNALYDLMHNNGLEQIPRKGLFQWYDVRRLQTDIEKIAHLPLVHFATEPLPMLRIINELFPDKQAAGHDKPAAFYDFKTLYAKELGGQGDYMAQADEVLSGIASWVRSEGGV